MPRMSPKGSTMCGQNAQCVRYETSSISSPLEGEWSQSSLCGVRFGFASGSSGSRSPSSPMVEGLPARKASNASILSRLEDEEVDDQISLPG